MYDPCIPSVPPWNVPHASLPHRILHAIRHAPRHVQHHVGHVAQLAGPIPDHICQFAFKGALIGMLAFVPPSAGPTPPAPAHHGTAHAAGPALLGAPGGGFGGGGSGIIYGQFEPIPVQYGYDIWGPFVVTPGGGENLPSVPTEPSTPILPPNRAVPEPTTLAVMAPPLAVLFMLAALRSGGRPLPVRPSQRLNGSGM